MVVFGIPRFILSLVFSGSIVLLFYLVILPEKIQPYFPDRIGYRLAWHQDASSYAHYFGIQYRKKGKCAPVDGLEHQEVYTF